MKNKLKINQTNHEVEVNKKNDQMIIVNINGKNFEVELIQQEDSDLYLKYNGVIHKITVGQADQALQVFHKDFEAHVVKLSGARQQSTEVAQGSLVSPMPGKIFKVLKSEGQPVETNETILILEAMKMEHSIKATHAGKIKKIFYKEGELVQHGVELVSIE